MGKFIVSRSNYTVAKKHQSINDGVIYERDMSTLGGVERYADGQSPIYQSGNFVITVGTSNGLARNVSLGKWATNSSSGETWTEGVLSGMTSDIEGTASIKLKEDYLDLRNYAYYGSLSKLVEYSITDILKRFPGELYAPNYDSPAQYFDEATSKMVNYGANNSSLSGLTLVQVYNPYGIDIHTEYIDSDEESLKYFANGGYKNYTLKKYNNIKPITNWYVYKGDDANGHNGVDGCWLPGDNIAAIALNDSKKPFIYAFLNEKLEVVYLSESQNIHITPNEEMGFMDDFMDSCNMFQKNLLGYYTGKKGVSRFIVEEMGNDGFYHKKLKSFTFPIGEGGYNFGSTSDSMGNFIRPLAKIAYDYDQHFTDNMYRQMTHESIKNFDWTRNLSENTEDYDDSFKIIQAMIHIMGYTFDGEISYIDSIENTNTVTYNDVDNLSDYFLTDSLDIDGWDVKSIIPFKLEEFSKSDNTKLDHSGYTLDNQFSNEYYRVFSRDTETLIKPYSDNLISSPYYWSLVDTYEYVEEEQKAVGYYDVTEIPTEVTESSPDYIEMQFGDDWKYYTKKLVSKLGKTPVSDNDEIRGGFKVTNCGVENVVYEYYNDKEYTPLQVNNEFMKRLKINSKYILNKKGTKESIRETLALFGMRDEEWVNSLNSIERSLYPTYPVYSIREYSVYIPNGIREEVLCSQGEYKWDFYNSKKQIGYGNEDYVSYQGLPISYRNIPNLWYRSDDPTKTTNDVNEAYLDADGNPMQVRELYPHFSNYDAYDGNPYYQMNGGWVKYYPISFDKDEHLVSPINSSSSKQTLRSLKQVNSLEELVSNTSTDIDAGQVIYVVDTTDNYAIIDGKLYPLKRDTSVTDSIKYYFEAQVLDKSVEIGTKKYSDYLKVSSVSGNDTLINLNLYGNNAKVRVYYTGIESEPFTLYSYSGTYNYKIVDGEEIKCEENEGFVKETGIITPDSIALFFDGKLQPCSSDFVESHYFQIVNPDFFNEISDLGWKQLDANDGICQTLSSVEDYFNGNNPHSGGFIYDNGESYLKAIANPFSYAINEELFNLSCLSDEDEALSEIESFGFQGLYDENNSDYIISDNVNTVEDTKCHSMVDKYLEDGTLKKYDLDGKSGDNQYTLSNVYSGYKNITEGVTNTVVNTKVVELMFAIQNGTLNGETGYTLQEQIKYIQEVVIPLVEQVLPSDTILRVKFNGGMNYFHYNQKITIDIEDCAFYGITEAELYLTYGTMNVTKTISISSGTTVYNIDKIPYGVTVSYTLRLTKSNPSKYDGTGYTLYNAVSGTFINQKDLHISFDIDPHYATINTSVENAEDNNITQLQVKLNGKSYKNIKLGDSIKKKLASDESLSYEITPIGSNGILYGTVSGTVKADETVTAYITQKYKYTYIYPSVENAEANNVTSLRIALNGTTEIINLGDTIKRKIALGEKLEYFLIAGYASGSNWVISELYHSVSGTVECGKTKYVELKQTYGYAKINVSVENAASNNITQLEVTGVSTDGTTSAKTINVDSTFSMRIPISDEVSYTITPLNDTNDFYEELTVSVKAAETKNVTLKQKYCYTIFKINDIEGIKDDDTISDFGVTAIHITTTPQTDTFDIQSYLFDNNNTYQIKTLKDTSYKLNVVVDCENDGYYPDVTTFDLVTGENEDINEFEVEALVSVNRYSIKTDYVPTARAIFSKKYGSGVMGVSAMTLSSDGSASCDYVTSKTNPEYLYCTVDDTTKVYKQASVFEDTNTSSITKAWTYDESASGQTYVFRIKSNSYKYTWPTNVEVSPNNSVTIPMSKVKVDDEFYTTPDKLPYISSGTDGLTPTNVVIDSNESTLEKAQQIIDVSSQVDSSDENYNDGGFDNLLSIRVKRVEPIVNSSISITYNIPTKLGNELKLTINVEEYKTESPDFVLITYNTSDYVKDNNITLRTASYIADVDNWKETLHYHNIEEFNAVGYVDGRFDSTAKPSEEYNILNWNGSGNTQSVILDLNKMDKYCKDSGQTIDKYYVVMAFSWGDKTVTENLGTVTTKIQPYYGGTYTADSKGNYTISNAQAEAQSIEKTVTINQSSQQSFGATSDYVLTDAYQKPIALLVDNTSGKNKISLVEL